MITLCALSSVYCPFCIHHSAANHQPSAIKKIGHGRWQLGGGGGGSWVSLFSGWRHVQVALGKGTVLASYSRQPLISVGCMTQVS